MGKEKYIAVMGVTGAGKSSFIKLVTGDDSIKVGESLISGKCFLEAVAILMSVDGTRNTRTGHIQIPTQGSYHCSG